MWIENRSRDIPAAIFLKGVMEKFDIKSRRALAKFLDVHETYISKYMSGTCRPSYDRCLKIKELLAEHGMNINVYDIRPKE